MSTPSLHPQIDLLASSIDTLTTSLSPLLSRPLASTSSKLPLLDQAKLHVLTTYALESVLFSYLKLNGVDAKSHPIFAELARVKSYFAKISSAENPQQHQHQQRLNTDVAKRFVARGLAGNERYDRERGERENRGGVKRGSHVRFGSEERQGKDQDGEGKEGVKRIKVVRADADEADGESEDEDGTSSGAAGSPAQGGGGGKSAKEEKGKGKATANALEKKARLKAKKERRKERKERGAREAEMQ